jgi:predicted nucleic acid-binding protein
VPARKLEPATTWAALPVGSRLFVDTAPIIYVLEDRAPFAQRFAGLFDAAARGELQLVISPVTLAEVLVGPLQADQEALAQRYQRALAAFELVPLGAEVAVQAARLRVRYRLKLPDAFQLACALAAGAQAMVTHDRDYAAVKGLAILSGEGS